MNIYCFIEGMHLVLYSGGQTNGCFQTLFDCQSLLNCVGLVVMLIKITLCFSKGTARVSICKESLQGSGLSSSISRLIWDIINQNLMFFYFFTKVSHEDNRTL